VSEIQLLLNVTLESDVSVKYKVRELKLFTVTCLRYRLREMVLCTIICV